MNNKSFFSFSLLKKLTSVPGFFTKTFVLCFIFLSFAIAGYDGFCEEASSNKEQPQANKEQLPANPEAPMTMEMKLSIKDVISLALENNLDIMVEKFNPKISDEDITSEKAKFDPSYYLNLQTDKSIKPSGSSLAGADTVVNRNNSWDTGFKGRIITGADYSLDFTNKRTRTNSSFSSLNPQYLTELKLNLTQPLLRDFGLDVNRTQIRIAKNNKEISLHQFKDTVMTTISDAEKIYWDLIFSIENRRVSQLSLERAQDLYERNKKQVEVGTLAPIEILVAEAEVAARKEDVIVAEAAIKSAEDKLKKLINIKGGDEVWETKIIPIDKATFNPKEFNLEESLHAAFQKRPDYLQALVDLDNKGISLKFAKNQLLPILNFVGNFGVNGLSGRKRPSGFGNQTRIVPDTANPGHVIFIPPETFDRSENPLGESYEMALQRITSGNYYSWVVGLQLEIPLGNRTAKSNYTKSTLENDRAVTSLANLRQKITVEMRDVVRNVKTNIERIEATRKARELAVRQLEAEEKRYEVGMSTTHDLLEFQEALAKAESRELQALIDYNKSLVAVEKSKGTILDTNDIKLKDDASI